MALLKNPRTGNWEADFRSNAVGRLHVSLRTKKKAEAIDRHAAIAQLVREHPLEVIEDLRHGRVTVEAIARVYLARQPFASLDAGERWPTLGDARAQHLAALREQTELAAGTIKRRELVLTHAGRRFGDARRVDTITPDEVAAWKATLAAEGVTGTAIVGWTVAQYLIHFGALYRWLTRREERAALRARRAPRMLHNPVESEIVPARSETTARALSKEEAQRLLAATPDALRFFVGLGLFCGLRLGETRMLRPPPHDVDLETGLIVVQARGDRETGWRPKSKRRREVPIAAEFLPIVQRHAATYASDRWMLPSAGDRRTTRHGLAREGPIARATLLTHFEAIVRRAGLPYGKKDPMGITFHTLRHTFASWLVMAGVDLFTVAKLMGHADTQLIESTYGHLSPDHKRLAVGKLGAGLTLDLAADADGGQD